MQVAEQFLNLLENRTIRKNKLQFALQKTFPFLKILGYNGELLIINMQVIMAGIRYLCFRDNLPLDWNIIIFSIARSILCQSKSKQFWNKITFSI